MSPLAAGLMTIFIMLVLFAAFVIWMERGRFRQKAEAREEAKLILEQGEIEDIKHFEHVCRVLFIAWTSVLHEDKEAAELYTRLQDLKANASLSEEKGRA